MDHAAVIFDLDGTLLDSLADIAEAANRVLASNQMPTHEIPAFRQFVGNGVEALFERAMPSSQRDEASIAAASLQFRRIYGDTWNLTTSPYPGINDLLEALARQQIKMAVLSNKPHANTLVCVNEFFDPSRFEIVFGQREDVPCKPDPAAAMEIASTLGVATSRCIFVGDSNVDMQTAVRAGMTAIGVTWGFRSREELISSGAHRTIDHPRELLYEI